MLMFWIPGNATQSFPRRCSVTSIDDMITPLLHTLGRRLIDSHRGTKSAIDPPIYHKAKDPAGAVSERLALPRPAVASSDKPSVIVSIVEGQAGR
ncbi:MAG: hypothetical protein ABI650_05230, partial [Dokdonella sp.]